MDIIQITKDQLEKALGGVVKVLIQDNDYEVLLDIPAMIELKIVDVVNGAVQVADQLIEQLDFPKNKTIEVNGELELSF